MVALPLCSHRCGPDRPFRSDTHRSLLGWRRVPYIWLGTLIQFGGFAIMPFALLVLSGDTHGPAWVGQSARRSRSCWSAPAAHHADRRPRARDRSRPAKRAPACRRAAVRDAAGRHGRERAGSSARCWPTSASFA
jgi:hypothetical protein